MRDALARDLALLPDVELTVSVDPRFPLPVPGVRVYPVERPRRDWPLRPFQQVDAVWLIAPETAGRLARLATLVESTGQTLLGPASSAVRAVAARTRLLRRLAGAGVPVPETRQVARGAAPSTLPWPAPIVVKPGRGAGGEGVSLVRLAAELPAALARARAADAGVPVLLQRFVPGTPASVSLLCAGGRAVPLALNRQHVRLNSEFAYEGGETPYDHPLAQRALEVAAAACSALPGLRGYVGVDLVLTDEEAVVLEINPRLTTSYLGLRRSLDANPAALALDAALGRLPGRPAAVRRVRFDDCGEITREETIGPGARRAALAGLS